MGEECYSIPDGASCSSEILFLIKLSTLSIFVKALLYSVGTVFMELVIGYEGSYCQGEKVAILTLKYALHKAYDHFVSQVPDLSMRTVKLSELERPNPNFQNGGQNSCWTIQSLCISQVRLRHASVMSSPQILVTCYYNAYLFLLHIFIMDGRGVTS